MSPHYGTIKRVIEFIEKNIGNRILLNDLSQLTDLSPNHFHKIFTETMGITPNVFIIKMKLDKAKELLIRTTLPISEISSLCGFENIPYFSYLFKKQVELSPGEFRKRHSYI
jgi:AraC-like DNA-binding protein